jgi:hypothetical protein
MRPPQRAKTRIWEAECGGHQVGIWTGARRLRYAGVRQSMGLILEVENLVHSLAALHRSSLQLVTIPPTIVKAGEARD